MNNFFEDNEENYGWVISKDVINEGEDTYVAGPRWLSDENKKLLSEPKKNGLQKFRMKDDDGEIYYYGWLTKGDNVQGFEPLDDFGMPNAGCTSIEFYENGEWVYL